MSLRFVNPTAPHAATSLPMITTAWHVVLAMSWSQSTTSVSRITRFQTAHTTSKLLTANTVSQLFRDSRMSVIKCMMDVWYHKIKTAVCAWRVVISTMRRALVWLNIWTVWIYRTRGSVWNVLLNMYLKVGNVFIITIIVRTSTLILASVVHARRGIVWSVFRAWQIAKRMLLWTVIWWIKEVIQLVAIANLDTVYYMETVHLLEIW
jgi:hypothetical protein